MKPLPAEQDEVFPGLRDLRAEASRGPLWLRWLLLLVAVATAVVMAVVRVPVAEPEKEADAFVQMAGAEGAGGLLDEQVRLMDPAALFLPVPESYSRRVSEEVRPVVRRELYGLLAGRVVARPEQRARPAPAFARVPLLSSFAEPEPDRELSVVGAESPGRFEDPQVLGMFVRKDGVGERRSLVPIPEGMRGVGGPARPLRFLVRVDSGRMAGSPLLVESGTDPSQEQFARRLMRRLAEGAHPLESGLWEVTVLW